jgi:hypothetical protein
MDKRKAVNELIYKRTYERNSKKFDLVGVNLWMHLAALEEVAKYADYVQLEALCNNAALFLQCVALEEKDRRMQMGL